MDNIVHVLRLILSICLLLIVPPVMTAVATVSEAEALLRVKRSLNNAAALESWQPGTDPCDRARLWTGVICTNNIVTGLRLRGMGLSGDIDVVSLAQIPGLRMLTLMNNSFSGPIPEFNQIGALKALYISKNQFSGEIPPEFFANMESMKKVWLSDNKFTGPIPTSLAGLPRIIEIHLENNQFSGPIPDLKQTTLTSIDFSNNNLEGEIPADLSRFNDSCFRGNPGLCGARLGTQCKSLGHMDKATNATTNTTATPATNATAATSAANTTGPTVQITHDMTSRYISMGIMGASVFILALMLIGIIILKKQQEDEEALERDGFDEPSMGRRHRSRGLHGETSGRNGRGSGSSRSEGSSNGGETGDLEMVNEEKGVFRMADLMKAAAEVIEDGTLGSAYKAVMTNGTSVVVKRVKEMNRVGRDVFDAEMRRLGGLRHKNIVTPLAYHYRKEEKLLVHEFMPKGSLLYALHGDRGVTHSELNWGVRLKIIRGIAQGLGYLHEELSSYQIPHGDLQSSNVLLANDYEPLLTGFGYVSLTNATYAAQTLTAFRSPEALQFNQISPKSDVYCLGIVILEVVTGMFPSQYLNNGNGGTDVVQWAKSAIADRRESEVLDPEISDSKSDSEQMKMILRIGAACAESNPDLRLDLREAIKSIEEIHTGGGGGGGGAETAGSMNVMPSLRDGYADQIEEGRGSGTGAAVSGGGGGGGASTSSGAVGNGNRSVSFAVDVT